MSDALDGFLARKLGVVSERGARLDSLGDLALAAALPVGVAWLWPELVLREIVAITIIGLCYVIPIGYGLIRFRRLTSYHTWGAKATAVVMAPGLLALLATGRPELFYVATGMLVLAELEELAITRTLPQWRVDVPTFAHAMALRIPTT